MEYVDSVHFGLACSYREAGLAYGDVVCTSNTWHGRAGGLPALHLLILDFVFYDGDLAPTIVAV